MPGSTFRNEAETPRAGLVARAQTEEELKEPFRDEQKPEVVLFGDFGTFSFDVLEQRREECCTFRSFTRVLRAGGAHTIEAALDERLRQALQHHLRLHTQILLPP